MWNEIYERPGYHYGTNPAAFLTRAVRHLGPGAKALCVADGEGRNSVFLAAQGHQVSAFDPAKAAVTKARALAASQAVDVDFHVSGIEDWTWDVAEWDALVAICIQFLGPIERAQVFAHFRRVVRPGGVLLLHGYAPRQVENGTGGPPDAAYMYTLEMLEDAFAGWEVLERADYDVELADGPGHNGTSALIDFVARKPVDAAG